MYASEMISSNKRRLELLKMLCRICAKEDSRSIQIFGETGKRQNLIVKIKACLPIHIQENDNFPKQICLACLTKLDSFYEMHVLCKDAQVKIERKFYSLRENDDLGKTHIAPHIEEKLRNLTESYPVSYGDSAVICLTREVTPTPPPAQNAASNEAQILPQASPVEPIITSVGYLAPASAPSSVAPSAPLPTATEEVFPQTLIQVPQNPASEQPVVYQNHSVAAVTPVLAPAPASRQKVSRPLVPAIKSMASPAAAPTNVPNRTSIKRKISENDTNDRKMCIYCNKMFTDDIIDHHVSLHLRQSFSSCVECGKNFRSEEAMQKHRCEDKKSSKTIDLDSDDVTIVL